ncbi:MAG: hypothetical protein IJH63_00230 [Methanobrevibacter sp.]|nr:hypothetical protein [Methanobrevibacter sp.]
MFSCKQCYFNVVDDAWWTVDEYGVCWGIGLTPEESISEAEFLGLDCSDVFIDYS